MASSAASSRRTEDIHAAIAKAAELRSLHASLVQRIQLGSPAALGPPAGVSPSPLLRRSNLLPSAGEDYPIFAASNEDESSRSYRCLVGPESRSFSETWRSIKLGQGKIDETVSAGRSEHYSTPCSEHSFRNEHLSNRISCSNGVSSASLILNTPLNSCRTSPGHDIHTARRSANISVESGSEHNHTRKLKNLNILHDSEPQPRGCSKQRGRILSWLFSRQKTKSRPEMSPDAMQFDEMGVVVDDWGSFSFESLKKEVHEANRKRGAAHDDQVSEMRSSIGDMQQKLADLEAHCEELKQALKQAKLGKKQQVFSTPSLSVIPKCNKSMPVSHAAMAEGFIQLLSESRLSVNQLCKTLMLQLETDCDLAERLNVLLQPHRVAISSSHSKLLLHHVEGLVNQSLYQDFENCVFQRNGSPKFLDPQRNRQANFASFIAMRNLSWNEVLRKGTKCYDEEFSRFCDRKTSSIAALLNWPRPWPEQLLRCFFVAAKCVWLLHQLAFSFSPPLAILRVVEGQNFDPLYMHDVSVDRKGTRTAVRVKIMVMPGFYIQDRVIKCRVLCKH
ncbi:IRK-interacting protein-like [Curcuma longa]|uniref:IRK-interacting protein-like n=1 Tax=Curcuma longa TaxID=136217 RepID=UPI003D9E2214